MRVIHGDSLVELGNLAAGSVDAIVTDPPYELGFMGKAWDASGIAYDVGLWTECLRVLKPGGHLLAFGGTRTWHRLACAIEDAGFEIRDTITWLYGSGFPKSLDVSKAIDKAAGATRKVVSTERSPFRMADPFMGDTLMSTQTGDTRKTDTDGYIVREITASATEGAAQWQGWGTALKPASEPIVVARKPLAGTVAANVLAYGTGGLNIDATRVGLDTRSNIPAGNGQAGTVALGGGWREDAQPTVASGRWPANVLLSHAPECDPECAEGCPVAELDAQSGNRPGRASQNVYSTAPKFVGGVNLAGDMAQQTGYVEGYNDQGGASRFFPVFRYQAKAPTKERPKVNGVAHPTVKPLALMRWLVRLVTPPGGVVLDPFAGSGTTGEAALLEGFDVILIERDESYLPLIETRRARIPVPRKAVEDDDEWCLPF